MEYWKSVYGKWIGNNDFIEGIIAAVDSFGIWKNGVQVIGCLDSSVVKIIAEVKKELEWSKEERL